MATEVKAKTKNLKKKRRLKITEAQTTENEQ